MNESHIICGPSAIVDKELALLAAQENACSCTCTQGGGTGSGEGYCMGELIRFKF